MYRYEIWDKKSPIYTIAPDSTGKSQWTAKEYLERHPWLKAPNAKVVVSGGAINGALFIEYYSFVDSYKQLGLKIEKGMTDREILDAIEAFENTPPPAPPKSAEERIADTLEVICICLLQTETNNVSALCKLALEKGVITPEQCDGIVNRK
jgi:hypothetical protein